ncbi:F-box domain-containing protein, partial [Cephalotus follicularis]
DIISKLPKDIFHQVLSRLDTKEAVRTSFVSKKWETLWNSIPILNFNSMDFRNLKSFKKFVNYVLSLRDDDCTVHAVSFHRGSTDNGLMNKVIDYAVTHSVRHLNVSGSEFSLFTPSLFTPSPKFYNCQTLQNLALRNFRDVSLPMEASLFNSLTALHLKECTLVQNKDIRSYNPDECFDPFLGCVNLKFLCLHNSMFSGGKTLKLNLPQVVSLTIKGIMYYRSGSGEAKVELFAPKLTSLSFTSCGAFCFSKMDTSSLECVFVDIIPGFYVLVDPGDANKMNKDLIKMMEGLQNAQFLTLTYQTIEAKICEEDIISKLPKDIFHQVLSRLDTKEAVRTSFVSKKWETLWNSIPILNFNSMDFRNLKSFKKFVNYVLSLRDDDCTVHAVSFHRGSTDNGLMNKVIDYAVTHSVRNLNV